MERDTAEITASLTPRPARSLAGRSPRDIMRQLMGRGFQTLVLTGALIQDFTPGVGLFTEDDACFLLEDHGCVEDLFDKSAPGAFGTFLNDGLLTFSTTFDTADVNLEFRFCPGLDSANLVTHRVRLTRGEYVWWWRSIAAGILDLADVDQGSVRQSKA